MRLKLFSDTYKPGNRGKNISFNAIRYQDLKFESSFSIFFRQCMCCYRDIKNFERFQLVVQSMICLSIVQLKNIEKLIVDHNNRISAHPSPSTSLIPNPLSTSKRVIIENNSYIVVPLIFLKSILLKSLSLYSASIA